MIYIRLFLASAAVLLFHLNPAISIASLGLGGLLSEIKVVEDQVNTLQSNLHKNSITVSQLNYYLSQDGVLESFYSKYQQLFNKDLLDHLRISTFKQNLKSIATHNLGAEMGTHSWFKGVNQFTDMTPQELERTYTVNMSTWPRSLEKRDLGLFPGRNVPFSGIPYELDYSQQPNVVTPVKNQGQCNTCVMFAFTAQLEAMDGLTKGRTSPDLSPQQLLDCAVPNFTCGDKGSDPWETYDYIKKNPITTWQQYPYFYPPKKRFCDSNGKIMQTQAAQARSLRYVDEQTLKEHLVNYGPLMVGFVTVFEYEGGILDNTQCGKKEPNHAALLVGYGTANNVDYWKIKNSYGEGWGEGGYLRIVRNNNHVCQIGSIVFIITTKN